MTATHILDELGLNASLAGRLFYFIEVQLLEDPVGAWTAAAPFLVVFLIISGAVTVYLLKAIEKEQEGHARRKKER